MLRVKRPGSGRREIRRAVRAHPPCAHKRQKFPCQACKRQFPGIQAPLGHNNDIQTLGDTAPVQAKKLPHEALYPVAPHRVAAFSRYREPKTPLAGPRAIIRRKKHKIPRKKALPRIVTIEKIRPPHKAVLTGKRKRAFFPHLPTRSGRKALAPLGAPAPQYGPPAGSAHARAKAVTSFPLDPAGLIGPFHAVVSF
jgi:hypothetical protein